MLAVIVILFLLIVGLAVAGWTLSVILSAALVGAIIGGLARLVIPGRQNIGILLTILLGWVGSLAGGVLGHRVFHVGSFATVLCEIAVAAVLVGMVSTNGGRASARQR